ncbi:MAG: tRNA lysidine(34) synthetase TilS [Methanothrix sp.]|nr:tRNA lysidine(34) synthetase TilS [Methanothrix sp.]
MTKCDKCPRKAIIYQRYSGMHLCREHFEEDVHRKIREALRKTGLFGRDARIAVGLDGGRKSATLAFVLKNLFAHRRDIDLLAVIIDEGKQISPTADQARHVAEQLRIPYILKSLPRHNLEHQEPPCRISSAEKREVLFCTAEENGAGILATGENLDDEALEIFVSYLQGNVDAVMGKEQKVAWIKPLRRIPEKEVRLYAIGHDLGYAYAGEKYHADEKHHADALRFAAMRLLRGFDCRHPGTNYSLLRGLEKGPAQEGANKGKAFK